MTVFQQHVCEQLYYINTASLKTHTNNIFTWGEFWIKKLQKKQIPWALDFDIKYHIDP